MSDEQKAAKDSNAKASGKTPHTVILKRRSRPFLGALQLLRVYDVYDM